VNPLTGSLLEQLVHAAWPIRRIDQASQDPHPEGGHRGCFVCQHFVECPLDVSDVGGADCEAFDWEAIDGVCEVLSMFKLPTDMVKWRGLFSPQSILG
jgi:hypothetical protein